MNLETKWPDGPEPEIYVSIICRRDHEACLRNIIPKVEPDDSLTLGVPDDCVLIFATLPRDLVESYAKFEGVVRIMPAYKYSCPDT